MEILKYPGEDRLDDGAGQFHLLAVVVIGGVVVVVDIVDIVVDILVDIGVPVGSTGVDGIVENVVGGIDGPRWMGLGSGDEKICRPTSGSKGFTAVREEKAPPPRKRPKGKKGIHDRH